MGNKKENRRIPLNLFPGQHQPIISIALYKRNQMIRESKKTSPSSAAKPAHQPPLSGIARCWECYEHDMTISNLRSVPGRPGKRYAQCGRMQDCYPSKRPKPPQNNKEKGKKETVIKPVHKPVTDKLIARHRSTLSEDLLMKQVDKIMVNFPLPDDWHEIIQAYCISVNGMADFEYHFHNANHEMDLIVKLYEKKVIDEAEFDQRRSQIERYVANLRPSAQPGAESVLPYLHNFGRTWNLLEPLEKRALLQKIFIGIYFDANGNIRKILAHSPFDELLNLPELLT